jgi:hypothetical protein
VVVSATDDHAVKSIDLYIDNAYISTTTCEDIAYKCSLSYLWSIRGMSGQHTATFKAYDWLGNTGALSVTFTIS